MIIAIRCKIVAVKSASLGSVHRARIKEYYFISKHDIKKVKNIDQSHVREFYHLLSYHALAHMQTRFACDN
jgi:hypothetical protein